MYTFWRNAAADAEDPISIGFDTPGNCNDCTCFDADAAITATKSAATLTPTITPMLVDTLEFEIARETIEPLLRDPFNCTVPCFWGIIPGKTSLNEVRVFFSPLGLRYREGTDPNSGEYFYSVGYESGIGRDSSVIIITSNNMVKNIEVSPEIIKQKEGSPRDWIAYSPETLIKKYGKPSHVALALDWGPNFVINLIMYFDKLDLIAFYSGYNMIPGRPRSPRVCPLTAPFDLVRVMMGPLPLDRPQFPTVALQQATSLTIDQFTQLMLGDPKQACFIVNGKAFGW